MSNVHVGETNRCFYCGISLNRRARRNFGQIRSFELSEQLLTTNPHLVQYAQHLFERYKMDSLSRVCRPCRQRADRFMQRKITEEIREQNPIEKLYCTTLDGPLTVLSVVNSRDPLQSSPIQLHEDINNGLSIRVKMERSDDSPSSEIVKMEPELKGPPYEPETVPVEKPVPEETVPKETEPKETVPKETVPKETKLQNQSQTMTLEGYTRLPISSRFCLVRGCHNRKLHRVHIDFRHSILLQHNIYIAPDIRICDDHINNDVWENLRLHCRPCHADFSQRQIADMLKLLKKKCDNTKKRKRKNVKNKPLS